MAADGKLVPAEELVKRNGVHFPNESADYRRARNALLVKEIELRRQMEALSALRRALPPGGEVTKDYRFVSESGPVNLADMFAGKDTLIIYNYMFGPQRQAPCPMCTSFMSTWEEKLPDVEQRVSLAMVARSPIERLIAAKQARGWTRLKIFPTSAAISPATMSAPRMTMSPATPSSPAGMAPSAISGAGR